jgi:hypothetical protein
MQTPIVKEITALAAHRKEVELVRASLLAVPYASERSEARLERQRVGEPGGVRGGGAVGGDDEPVRAG